MRRLCAIAVLTMFLGGSSAEAAWRDFPTRDIERSRIVRVIKRLITIVNGDHMSEPKP